MPDSSREVHGLAFLTLVSFIASFLAARVFTTITPTTVVVSGGIHFHHFWFGLAMVIASGWLSIVSNHPQYDRVFAIIFGLGAGLIGDEVGLLLTLGNYQSGLTYVFFVGVLSFGGMGFTLIRYRSQLEATALSLGAGERLAHLGIFIAGFSAFFWAFDHSDLGFAFLTVGVVAMAAGVTLHGRRSRTV